MSEQNQTQPNDLLTVGEAARILRVSEVSVRTWLRDGTLKGHKIGKRQWRIRRTDLERYLSGKLV